MKRLLTSFLPLACAVTALAADRTPLRVGTFDLEVTRFYDQSTGLPSNDVRQVTITPQGDVLAFTAAGAWTFAGGQGPGAASRATTAPSTTDGKVRQRATARDGRVAEARAEGLFLKSAGASFERLMPSTPNRSWAPLDVRGVAFDSKDRLWFASPQGVGVLDGNRWTLYTGTDGLPYDDFTTVAAGENGVVWFGTHMGAIRFDGTTWEYRQGRRWLPGDDVRSIAVTPHGDAWIATSQGVGVIAHRPMTLAEKARFFEDEIDKRHRRTPYQYVHPVHLKRPGDKSEWVQTDSDNDGLWTSMYGAGQCYAWAATGNPAARARAVQAFEAMRFLRTVTEGGPHPAPRGFVARSILPTDGPDPNVHDSLDRDRRTQASRDHLWKIITPRWPKSADGKWYWKTDTSSDELDGHYFFYGLYYDLVASTDAEKQAVREHVAALTDHLLEHNYQLFDHDNKPTRWGIFNPENLNHNHDWWQERGTNSLSILSYLNVAWHITGDARYRTAALDLVKNHSYDMNVFINKTHLGFGSGNQSDDEMIFMNFYGLIKYEPDANLRQRYLKSFQNHWQNEEPEMNPVFDFLYAAVADGQSFNDAFGPQDLTPGGSWLEDSVDTLRRLPLDRIDWALKNSQRKDIVLLPKHAREDRGRNGGYRVNGKVLPIDERWVGHWNHDPWALDQGGAGHTLGDGGVFLLPYYMGLYHKFIQD